jgi:5'-deoxynucleotidase
VWLVLSKQSLDFVSDLYEGDNMEYDFFAYLSRMKYIKRWALMRSTVDENIKEHSWDVSVIAHALALIENKIYGGNVDEYKVLSYAMYHEAGEVITGDLPTPIKYFNPEIKNAYKDLEKNACQKLIAMLPEQFQQEYQPLILPDTETYEYKLVKGADRLSAYLKCVEEVKAGNSEFKKAKATIGSELKKCKIPEVEYYLKEFAPAYDLTLDELE